MERNGFYATLYNSQFEGTEMRYDRQHKETLFVCDLDGTILDRNSRLLPRTADVFGHLLVDPDLHFTFATARSVKSALAVIPELQPERPLISYNGAFVTDPQSGEVLQENCFSPADVIYLSYLILTCGAAPFVYALSPAGKETITWELGRETPGMRIFDQRRGIALSHPPTLVGAGDRRADVQYDVDG